MNKIYYHFSLHSVRRQLQRLRKLSLSINASLRFAKGRWMIPAELSGKWMNLQQLSLSLIPVVGKSRMRKTLGLSALAIGLSLAPSAAQAQIFNEPVSLPFGLVDSSGSIDNKLLDLDNDGDLDMLTVQYIYYYGANALYFENIGTADCPLFEEPLTNPFGLVITSFGPIDAADLDADGDYDLMVGQFYPGDVFYYENTGTAASPAFGSPLTNPFGIQPGYYISAPALIDLDTDGDFDLVTVGYYNKVYFQRNIGYDTVPVFDAVEVDAHGFVLSGYFSFPEAVNLDGDGDQDLLLGMADGSFMYLENIGDSVLPSVSNPFGLTSLSYYTAFSSGDLDSDGDIDIMALNTGYYSYENAFEYFRNEEVPGNVRPTLGSVADTSFCGDNSASILLSGISAGASETQPLTLTAVSSDVSVVDNCVVTYSGGSTAVLSFDLPAGGFGLDATITVTVDDGQCEDHNYERSFLVHSNDCSGWFESEASRLNMVPNPVKDYFHLQGISTDIEQLDVFDAQGRFVKSLNPSFGKWFIGDLPNGLYCLKAISANALYVSKFLKQ